MKIIMYLFPTIAWRMEYMSVKGWVKSLATLVRCERLVSAFNIEIRFLTMKLSVMLSTFLNNSTLDS